MKNIILKTLDRDNFLGQKSYLEDEVRGAPVLCFLQTYHVFTKSRGIDIWAKTLDRYEFVWNMVSTKPEEKDPLTLETWKREKMSK